MPHSSPRNTFRNIGIMGRPGKATVVDTIIELVNILERHGLNPIIDDHTAAFVPLAVPTQTVSPQLIGEACDLVIVVGGDGSMLVAAHYLAKTQTPVLGINRGRLGFLADVSPDELSDKVEQVLSGNYQLDRRFLLHTEIRRAAGEIAFDALALNDVVLHAGKSVHMIDFELEIDGSPVYRQHSDGVIIATPTGSTAYGLSAGGPILHPSMDALVLVPMNPHTLSSRPIVVGGQSEVKLKMASDQVQGMVSTDGMPSQALHMGDVLTVRKHPYKMILLHPPSYDFYAACRDKLGWNRDIEH